MASRAAATNGPTLSALAFGDGTPKKAFLTALVVGTILTSINHGDGIITGQWPPVWKILLTFCVPYCVTTWGAITGKRALCRRVGRHDDHSGLKSARARGQAVDPHATPEPTMTYPAIITVPATSGANVEIPDVERFCRHLQDFHRTGVTTHTESGYDIRVDDGFRALVQSQVPAVRLFD